MLTHLLQVNIAYNSGIIFSVVDERMGSYPSECVQKFINLALRCCKDEPDDRPSMSQVVRELENIWRMMPETDTEITESPFIFSNPGKVVSPPSPSSSSMVETSYASENVTGSDLISGVTPSVAPR